MTALLIAGTALALTAGLVLGLLQLTGGPTLMTRHRTTPTTTTEETP